MVIGNPVALDDPTDLGPWLAGCRQALAAALVSMELPAEPRGIPMADLRAALVDLLLEVFDNPEALARVVANAHVLENTHGDDNEGDRLFAQNNQLLRDYITEKG